VLTGFTIAMFAAIGLKVEGLVDSVRLKEGRPLLIVGDTSWAMRLEEALPDLDRIGRMKGRKLMIKGNHDYWWQSAAKLRKALDPSIKILQASSIIVDRVAVAGTRGWTCPNDVFFEEHDAKIYEREVGRLRLALKSLEGRSGEFDSLIVALHYPPTNDKHETSGFTELIDEYRANVCVYGHLHGDAIKRGLVGTRGRTQYHLVSADAVSFAPAEIMLGRLPRHATMRPTEAPMRRRHIETIDIAPDEFERQVKSWLETSSRRMTRFEVTGLRKLAGAGGEYEIDAVAQLEIFGGAQIVVLVECKYYKSAVKRDVVILLGANVQDIGAHKGIVFATSGFQSGALEYARAHGIATVHVVDGKATYETKGYGHSPDPPPWLNLPKVAGWMISLTPDGHESFQLLGEQHLEPLSEWLGST